MGRWIGLMGIMVSLMSVSCNSGTDEMDVVGGTFVGYTYSELPVVETKVELEYGYTLTFKAYDLGGETRFVIYAQREKDGTYYSGLLRLGIEDPQGNAFTFYHNSEGDAIDKPIIWTRLTTGVHQVSVEFHLYLDKYARASFDVPLVREPVSSVVIAGIGLAIFAGVILLVFVMRKR
jgi:hypothetical protein